MNLTAEQRDAFSVLIGVIEAEPRPSFVDESVDIIRGLLSGSNPAWEATVERQDAIDDIIEWLQTAIDDIRSSEFVSGSFDKEYVMRKVECEHWFYDKFEPTNERILTIRYRMKAGGKDEDTI